MPLLSLPVELVSNIFDYLEVDSILRCSETCTFLREVVQHSRSIEYQLLLAKNGYFSRPAILRAPFESPESFTQHLTAWKELRYRRKDSFTISMPFAAWDYFDGLWVQAYRSTTEGDGPARTLKFCQMPSVVRDLSTKEWVFEDIGLDVMDIRAIPQRNLLVLMEARGRQTHVVHLRTIDKNTPHPEATGGAELVHAQDKDIPAGVAWCYNIEVQGDLIAVLHYTPQRHNHENIREELVIWNWMTGAKINMLSLPSDRAIGSFTLIDKTLVLLAVFSHDERKPWAALQLWKFDNSERSPTGLETEQVDDNPLHLASLQLPELHERALVLNMELRSDPPPCWNPALSCSYFPAATDRVYVITLEVFSQLTEQDVDFRNALREISFYVRLPDTLNVFKSSFAAPSPSFLTPLPSLPTSEPLMIPWAEWGPRNTRIFGSRPHSLSWVYGDKYLTVEGQSIVLYDFSPWSLDEDVTPPPSPESDTLVGDIINDMMNDPELAAHLQIPWQINPPHADHIRPATSTVYKRDTIVHCGNVLTSDVHTGLPYRKTVAGWFVGTFNLQVMLDNEHILMLRKPLGGPHAELICLTF